MSLLCFIVGLKTLASLIEWCIILKKSEWDGEENTDNHWKEENNYKA